jgi:quercetin dioxygenase-like cupin family protein
MSKNHKPEIDARNSSAQVTLPCPDLSEALEFFTGRLGFRIDMITPADEPHTAVVSGHGVTLRLESEPAPPGQGAEGGWNEGRAGMRYRDLIPGRLGGRFIASHIRIPEGGEVPDYVHYHKIRFQMIYCKAGWARLVYEDQGPPFIFEAGDCVLQPPEIRHRVLEASPGFEVVEIASPAAHETFADHDLRLPTSRNLPDRVYNGQRFVFHRASQAEWAPWILSGFEARDTGIAAATGGLASVRVVRTTASPASPAATQADAREVLRHAGEFLFFFVLRGELGVDGAEEGNRLLREGDSFVLLSGREYGLRASADLELLEARLPA